jgi:O-antigen/teichoic acid export membrane protein
VTGAARRGCGPVAVAEAESRASPPERVARHSTNAAMAAFPIGFVFLVWPEAVLALFGDEFRSSANLLRVLAIGYLVNTSTGSVANLLMMTGHERDYRNICIVGAALNAIIASVAIWQYGALGAALATAATLIVISLGAAVVSRRRLGFSGLVRSAISSRG